MQKIKQQIFDELAGLEEAVRRLSGAAAVAGKQTDLEVAILAEQNKKLREKNKRAGELIDESLKILKVLK
ncbi:MAG: hypothetical protein LBJ18_04770 [Rickettsiales bacterium]|jgi:hypothetical protein|nr:hypothetical protein [Rickettsiales bacterium]